MFRLRATVSGGVTGFRTGYVRNDSGVIYFATREAAAIEAIRLTKVMNNKNSLASFSYEVAGLFG